MPDPVFGSIGPNFRGTRNEDLAQTVNVGNLDALVPTVRDALLGQMFADNSPFLDQLMQALQGRGFVFSKGTEAPGGSAESIPKAPPVGPPMSQAAQSGLLDQMEMGGS